MIKTRKKSHIAIKLMIAFSIILAIFFGGYFFLDKLIVPKYFGQYGINNIGDLIGVVRTLYKSPNESKMIKNGYTQADSTRAIEALKEANYSIEDDGTIIYDEEFKGDGTVELTDREFAAVCDIMLKNKVLEEFLPNLSYLNLINIDLLELIITPDKETLDENNCSTKAEIDFTIKIKTDDIREQIAQQMDTPVYLLKMIIPDTLYFKVTYNFDLDNEAEKVNGKIAVNGRTATQSEILINLLIDFIFPEEEQMDYDKFIKSVGDIILEGIDILGNFKFKTKIGNGNQNGILVNAEK